MVRIADRGFAALTAREFHDIVRLRLDLFVVEQKCAYPEPMRVESRPDTTSAGRCCAGARA